MAKVSQFIMWSLFILILWATSRNCEFSSGIQQTTPIFVLEQNITLEENEGIGGQNLSMIGEAFRRQISQILVPAESQNLTEEIDDLLALSNISLSDYQRENITISNIQRLRDRKKKQRLQAIKDAILHLTGRGGTFNESSIQSIGSQSMADLLQNLTVPIDDEASNGSATAERQVQSRAVDSEAFEERKRALSRMVTDWLASYNNATEPDTRRERLWVEFADLGLDDTFIAPRAFEWIICSHRDDVNFEVFLKLSTPWYPLPIRRHANSVVQLLVESKHRLGSKCTPSGWQDMPIMYFNDQVEPRHAILDDFLPTSCFCVD